MKQREDKSTNGLNRRRFKKLWNNAACVRLWHRHRDRTSSTPAYILIRAFPGKQFTDETATFVHYADNTKRSAYSHGTFWILVSETKSLDNQQIRVVNKKVLQW